MKPLDCQLWKIEGKDKNLNLRELLDIVKTYEKESHVVRELLKCSECGQLYFYEFYEEIDWENGNDPQYRTAIPVESEDQADKMAKMSQVEILKFSPRLQNDWPKDAEEKTGWFWSGK